MHDIRFEASMRAYQSRPKPIEDLRVGIQNSLAFAQRIEHRASHLFSLAIDEEDDLKKFLFCFTAMESATHATFKQIQHEDVVSGIVQLNERAQRSGRSLFGNQKAKLRPLRDRFTWCVVAAWTHLSDADVDEFLELKKWRDDIAHGSIVVPPKGAAARAERLATRVLQDVRRGP